MAGNVWEWVGDCFENSIRRLVPAGTRDPLAKEKPGCRRFLRGGSWQSFGGILERRTAEGMFDIDVVGRGVRCVYDFGTQHKAFGR